MAVQRKASSLIKGAEGRKRTQSEFKKSEERKKQRQQQRMMPFRIWVRPGTSRKIIILDEEPLAFRHEHAVYNPTTKKNDTYLPCIAEFDDCPACRALDNDPAYVMYLSVIDLEPYTIKSGKHAGTEVPFTRKLLVVKAKQQSIFNRRYARLAEKGRNLRGLIVTLHRDDDRTPAIGNDIEFGKRVKEEVMRKKFIRRFEDRKGNQKVEKLYVPYDYDELFPAMSREELAAVVGDRPTPGSAAESDDVDSKWQSPDDDVNWNDEKPRRRKTAKKTGKKTTSRKRQQSEDDYDDDIPF